MNLVVLKGNLTRDPEVKFLQSGDSVTNFGLGMNERWTDQKTGERRERATFVECNAWNKQGETINEYFQKGSEILIQGQLVLEQWETDQGEKRSRLTIRVNRFEFCGSNGNGNGNSNGNNNGNGQRTAPDAAPPAPTTPESDDDVPF